MKIKCLFLICFVLICNVFSIENSQDNNFLTISVSKFNCYSDSDNNFLGESFSDCISTKLSCLKNIKLYERSQFEKIAWELQQSAGGNGLFDEQTMNHVGKVIAIDYMIIGNITESNDELRVNYRVLEIKTGQVVLADELEGNMGMIFELQDILAFKIIDSLNIKMSEFEKQHIVKRAVTDLEAYELYNRSLKKNDIDKKIFILEKAVEKDSEFLQALYLLADLYYKTDDKQKSIESYKKIINFEPDDFKSRYNLGLLYFDTGDYKLSKIELEYCKNIKDQDPDVWYNLGLLNEYNSNGERQGDGANLSESYKCYEEAINLNPNYIEANFNIGILNAVFAKNTQKINEQKTYLKEAINKFTLYLKLLPDAFNKEEVESNINLFNIYINQLN